MNPTAFAVLVQTLFLVILTLVILYPVIAYAQNVMHTGAILLLAASLVFFTVSSMIEQFSSLLVLAEFVSTVSTATFAAGLWLFAREFVRRDQPLEEGFDGGNATGGFEDVRDG